MASVNLFRANSFIDAIGVNTHVAYTDGLYDNYSNIISDLAYLGINHVRDAIPNSTLGGYGYLHYAYLAEAGIKFDFLTTGSDTDLSATMSRLDGFEEAFPGAISSIEGPNEVNNFPVSYDGLSGNAAALAFQSALDTAVHDDPSLSGLPIYNLTSWPTLVGPSDAFNIHLYPYGGSEPGATLESALAEGQSLMPGAPTVITEAGYSSAGQGTDVDQLTQAKLDLNLIFDSEKAGVSQVYLYELLEAYSDPSGTDHEQHFGLFNYDGTPKPIATALHNLTSILADTGSDAATFTPTALSYSIADLPTTANSLMIEKSSGVYDLALWNEPTIWDYTTHQEVAAPATNVTISLASASNVSLLDPLTGLAAVATYTDVTSVTVSVVDHPVIVEIHPLVSSAVMSDPTSTSGQTYALYEALLGRAPDTTELNAGVAATGMSASDLAQVLLQSSEHTALHGHYDQLTDSAYVEQMYETVLGRTADGYGLASYEQALAGGESRATVATSIALSPEHVADLQSGYSAQDHIAVDAARLYSGFFGQAPAATSLATWETTITTGESLHDIAQGYLNSPAFQAKGNLSDAAFVDALYVGALGRHADGGGLASYLSDLQHGNSRVDVAISIAESAEAHQHLSASIEQAWHLP